MQAVNGGGGGQDTIRGVLPPGAEENALSGAGESGHRKHRGKALGTLYLPAFSFQGGISPGEEGDSAPM